MTLTQITPHNYDAFDAMVFRRINGYEKKETTSIAPMVLKELENPNLSLYAAEVDGQMVGWIALIYLPKVGKYGGRGYLYVDELWVQPEYRRRGIGRALMSKADECAERRGGRGLRLYANQSAEPLYKACGYASEGTAIFMEKMCL